MKFVDLSTQYKLLKPEIDRRIETVLNHGQYIMGSEVSELEQQLSEYTGSRHCIAVASGTDALLLALMALGVKTGDEVITSPFTFISTGEVISLLGAVPVFVDIDERTYNMDPGEIEGAITAKTKAVLPVSIFGQCADMEAINSIAETHGLPVIEDAAQSFGATRDGGQSCNLSTIGCTSFFPSKPLGCYGDGGACFTNDDELAAEMRLMRVHGQERRYVHTRIGINGRMDTLQAAILLAKLAHYPAEIKARAEIGLRYTDLIREHCPKIVPPEIGAGNSSVYAQYSIQADDRTPYIKYLNAVGIPTAVHYPTPLHRQPIYESNAQCIVAGSLDRAEAVSRRIFSLPMHPYLDESVQETIVSALASANSL